MLLVGFETEEAAALQDELACGDGAVAAGEAALLPASATVLAAGVDAVLDRVRGVGLESDTGRAAAAGAPRAWDPMGLGPGEEQGRVWDGAANAPLLLPASRGGDGRLALLIGPGRTALCEVQVGAHQLGSRTGGCRC